MALRFNPTRTREIFDSFLLKRELNDSREKYAILGRAAIIKLSTIIEAWLVGLNSEISPALQDCYAWLKFSIDVNEAFGDVGIPATRSSAFGLCHWMVHNENIISAHQDALGHYETHFATGGQKVLGPDVFNYEKQRFEENIRRGIPVTKREILNGYLEDYLADCIQGEQYERGISLYERVGGEAALDPRRIKKPVELGYWLCCQKMKSNVVRDEEVLAVGERVLRAHLQGKWLNHGQSIRAATWLKILYWHSGVTKTPLETILKAYDLMPDVPKPEFL